MKSLIKQLQDGEIAIKNDGSVEGLNRVLKAAFPKDTCSAQGGAEYYYAYKSRPTSWATGRDFLTSHSVSEFIKELDKMEKTRTITPEQAQSIIDIACTSWRKSLSNDWATDIVLKRNITVPERRYKQMREACTIEQHRLFDEIFGPDALEVQEGEYVVVIKGITQDSRKYVGQVKRVLSTKSNCINIGGRSGLHNGRNSKPEFRKATEEEIKKAQYYPDGTPCLVKNGRCQGWQLRYANGNGSFYLDGKKRGSTCSWSHHMKLDMNNLPVNE